tara:strand:- start:216 stop:791 length:576 start_codon:yes stop_codon:yes gene_type:complete
MIYLIDDDKHRMFETYGAIYLKNNPLITVFHKLVELVELPEAELVMLHDSINPEGHRADFEDDVIDAEIPIIVFSNAANFNTIISNERSELTSDKLYKNLKYFLDDYALNKTCNINVLAHGKNYMWEQYFMIESRFTMVMLNNGEMNLKRNEIDYFNSHFPNCETAIDATQYTTAQIRDLLFSVRKLLSND